MKIEGGPNTKQPGTSTSLRPLVSSPQSGLEYGVIPSFKGI